MKTRLRTRRTGFTLVELLVVMTIIGILTALLLPTLSAVVTNVQETANNAEIQQLEVAFQAYYEKYRSYPPDFYLDTNAGRFRNHLFQRSTRITEPIAGLRNRARRLTPDEALVFWLSRTRDNKTRPITGGGRIETFFDFDQERLVDFDNDGFPSFVPKYGVKAPYVYFQAANYRRARVPGSRFPDAAGWARPYRDSSPRVTWQGQGKFQIISAGMDGDYGFNRNNKFYPSGARMGAGDFDNQTSFSDGRLDKKLDI